MPTLFCHGMFSVHVCACMRRRSSTRPLCTKWLCPRATRGPGASGSQPRAATARSRSSTLMSAALRAARRAPRRRCGLGALHVGQPCALHCLVTRTTRLKTCSGQPTTRVIGTRWLLSCAIQVASSSSRHGRGASRGRGGASSTAASGGKQQQQGVVAGDGGIGIGLPLVLDLQCGGHSSAASSVAFSLQGGPCRSAPPLQCAA